MSNMSYCRFENTSQDMQDCFDALEEAGSIEALKEEMEMSEYELRGLKDFIDICQQVTELYNDNVTVSFQ